MRFSSALLLTSALTSGVLALNLNLVTTSQDIARSLLSHQTRKVGPSDNDEPVHPLSRRQEDNNGNNNGGDQGIDGMLETMMMQDALAGLKVGNELEEDSEQDGEMEEDELRAEIEGEAETGAGRMKRAF